LDAWIRFIGIIFEVQKSWTNQKLVLKHESSKNLAYHSGEFVNQ